MCNRYSVYRRIVEYYSDDPTGKKTCEDAFDMRKPVGGEENKKYVRENGEDVHVQPEELYRAAMV